MLEWSVFTLVVAGLKDLPGLEMGDTYFGVIFLTIEYYAGPRKRDQSVNFVSPPITPMEMSETGKVD